MYVLLNIHKYMCMYIYIYYLITSLAIKKIKEENERVSLLITLFFKGLVLVLSGH